MSTAKINIKNIDYFKYRKLVVDGCRDDYAACGREVKALCDAVQTLSFRDDEFDDLSDRGRLADIGSYYRQILAGKRVDPLDMRLKSGWWGDPNRTVTGYSAGKIKQTALIEVLAAKTRDWMVRHAAPSRSVSGGGLPVNVEPVEEKLEGPGLYVFRHRERQCFQTVGVASAESGGVFARCAERLKAAFDGSPTSGADPLAALLVISLASDWDFYFIPATATDGQRLLRILENDLILKHDTIWPHGLDNSLHIDTPIEVAEFRRSCLRHRWPPEYDTAAQLEPELDLNRLRVQIASTPASDLVPSPTLLQSSTPVAVGYSALPRSNNSGTASRGAHKDDSITDRPATPSRKTAPSSSRPAAGSNKSGVSSDLPQSLTSKTTVAGTSTKASSSQRPSTISKETTASAGAPDVSVASRTTMTASSRSPTKRIGEKQQSKPNANVDKEPVVQSELDDNTTHEAVVVEPENEGDSQPLQPLKRSGTFTSIPAAVEGDTMNGNQSTISECSQMTTQQ